MNTLILPVGLPRSGKSTWSRAYMLDHAGTAIVNPDSIRLALTGQAFKWESEPMVWAIARYMVESLFLSGHPIVILDACNLTTTRREAWVSGKWTCVLHLVPTDATTCTVRARLDERHELVPVIDLFNRGKQDPALDTTKWTYV